MVADILVKFCWCC